MRLKKVISTMMIIGMLTTIIVGCGSKKDEAESDTNTAITEGANTKTGDVSKASTDASSTKVKQIRVAVANDFSPFAYLDEKGNYTGYEVEVLKKIDEALPLYEFEYQTMSDQFVALTSNKVDLIAHQWESNPTRQETYLFGKEIVTAWAAYVITKPGSQKLQTYEDLEGKTFQTSQGSNDAYRVEAYNKEHNNAIKVVYSSGDTSVTLQKLSSGAIDAFTYPISIVNSIEKEYNVKLQVADEPLYYSGTYFIYRKDNAAETALQEAVDGVLKTLHEDGTLSALSQKYLDGDYSEQPADTPAE